MKRTVLNIAVALCCFLAITVGLAAAEESSAEHRELDPALMKVIDQTLHERKQREIEKRYPEMIFKQEMMAKMMGEMTLQDSMQSVAKPAIMSMIMGAIDNNSQNQQKERERQDAMNKLREQVAKIRQDAMDNIHSQAPMLNEMRNKMVSEIPVTRYLQDVFMPRQRDRTIEEFHAGKVVMDRMKKKPVPLPSLK